MCYGGEWGMGVSRVWGCVCYGGEWGMEVSGVWKHIQYTLKEDNCVGLILCGLRSNTPTFCNVWIFIVRF